MRHFIRTLAALGVALLGATPALANQASSGPPAPKSTWGKCASESGRWIAENKWWEISGKDANAKYLDCIKAGAGKGENNPS